MTWDRFDAMMREAVRRARALARNGVPPSGIVREIAPFFESCNYGVNSVLLIRLAIDAFGLTIAEGKDTPGWRSWGIEDAGALDAYLTPLIARNRPRWDVDTSSLRRLAVQIELDRVTGHDVKELIAYLRRAADGVVLTLYSEGRRDGAHPYVELGFDTPDPAAGWARVRALYDDSALGNVLRTSTIVMCQGERSWDDHLVLHHFDPSVKLDTLHLLALD